MHKTTVLSIFSVFVLLAFLSLGLGKKACKKQATNVAPATEKTQPAAVQPVAAETKPAPPHDAVINPNPSEATVRIVSSSGKWVDLTDKSVVPRIDWRYGSGESYLVRTITRGGKVEEVYEDYCTDYDYKEYKCRKLETLVVRTRWVMPNQTFRVITGAVVRLEGREICRPAEKPWRQTPVAEIRDPAWKPQQVERHFDSVADLRDFTRERGTWLVIASEKGAPLLGYRYPKALVYSVTNEGKTFYAFALAGHPKEEPAEPVQGCAAWPIHVEYRYLLPGVGHDTEYGAGCVSVFGFAAGSDVRDLHNVRMCILSRGEAYYYGEALPQYRLDIIQ